MLGCDAPMFRCSTLLLRTSQVKRLSDGDGETAADFKTVIVIWTFQNKTCVIKTTQYYTVFIFWSFMFQNQSTLVTPGGNSSMFSFILAFMVRCIWTVNAHSHGAHLLRKANKLLLLLLLPRLKENRQSQTVTWRCFFVNDIITALRGNVKLLEEPWGGAQVYSHSVGACRGRSILSWIHKQLQQKIYAFFDLSRWLVGQRTGGGARELGAWSTRTSLMFQIFV